MVAAAGCSDSEPELPNPAPAVAPAPDVGMAPAAPATAPAAGQPPAQAPGDVTEPELKPIQLAIQSFEAQNKRMPMHVDELVASGAIPALPKPPPGKIYFIDQATKRIRLGGADC